MKNPETHLWLVENRSRGSKSAKWTRATIVGNPYETEAEALDTARYFAEHHHYRVRNVLTGSIHVVS